MVSVMVKYCPLCEEIFLKVSSQANLFLCEKCEHINGNGYIVPEKELKALRFVKDFVDKRISELTET